MTEVSLQLFKITQEEIIPATKITPEDIILVLNEADRALYIYKGRYSLRFDEFTSQKIYERIINRFLNPNILFITTLEEQSDDTSEIIAVKESIISNFPNLVKFEFLKKTKDFFLFHTIRRKIALFNSYENSHDWRNKLSNFSNIRRLSMFNIFSILLTTILLLIKMGIDINRTEFGFINGTTINNSLWLLWKENLMFILIVLTIIMVINIGVNLVFVLFPMKFPLKPKSIKNDLNSLSSSIKTPDSMKSKSHKGKSISKSSKTPIIKPQISIKKDFVPPKIENDDEFVAPSIPKKKAIKLKVDKNKIAELAKKDTDEVKFILIECQICGAAPIMMPVPRKLISDAKEPVVDVSYLHGDPKHVVVAQLDHDFQVRRRRSSWIVYEKDYK